ncbi:hypothetical protein EON81_12830 [bacterium]|nr:MAG: hypothetical protein EON81_12830 [bacterium]
MRGIPLRDATIAELRSGLATDAHRLLFDHFVVCSAVVEAPGGIAQAISDAFPASNSVEVQRLASLREADDHRRKLLASHLCLKSDTPWNTVLDNTTEALDLLADLHDAIGIEMGADPIQLVAEVRALCARGRRAGEEIDPEEKVEPTATGAVAAAQGGETPPPVNKVIESQARVVGHVAGNVASALRKPWTLDCTPNQAQLACRLWAEGKSTVEVAGGADISKVEAEKVRAMANDFIMNLKRKPAADWGPFLAARMALWQMRYAATKEAVAA